MSRFIPAATAVTVFLTAAHTSFAAATVNVTGNVNISALGITADDTDIVFTGNFTLTVDTTLAFKISGINADGNAAVINFSGSNNIRLANSNGNVIIQEGFGAGSITITGGAAGAGFSTTLETGEIVDVRATIDENVNGNAWLMGNNTLLLSTSSAYVGNVQIGLDGGVAKIDVDDNADVISVTPTGDFTIDVSSAKTLTINGAVTNVGANTLTLIGGSSTSSIIATSGIALDNASSLLRVNSSITLDDLNIGATSGITLGDGVTFTLSDAVPIGANTLTITGTSGTVAETIAATNGFVLDNSNALITITGDSSNAMVISKVDVTGADLNANKGLDVNENVTITALTVSQNATIDVASGKSLGGTVTLNAAKILTVNNTGTVGAITATTAASTVLVTAGGTITTLTSSFAGNTIDVNETSTITNIAVNENTTLSVASTKTLTTTATVAASKILTMNEAGLISTVTLNGSNAELNVTSASGTVSTLNVAVDGGVLDIDNDCTIASCVMMPGVGDLTLQHGSRTIISPTGFDVNNNQLKFNEAGGVLPLVVMDTDLGLLDVNESTSITALTITGDIKIDVTPAKTLTTSATVSAGATLEAISSGSISTVKLAGSNAKLQMTGSGLVSSLSVDANGGLLDVDSTATVSNVAMTAGAGDLSIDVASGKTLAAVIDVNDNRLTLTNTGKPGTIGMDTDGGVLDVDANVTPTALTIAANVTIDVASGVTLSGTTDIAAKTLTLIGAGTMSRIESTTGTITADGTTTISDLRPTFGNGGTFVYGGTGASTISTLDNTSIGSGETFQKVGTGTLTVTNGLTAFFGDATSVHFDINEGAVVVGSSSANNDITFNDDGDDLTLASGATLTLYGSMTVSQAGSNVNFDADDGSIINLASSGDETFTAAADNDFQFLGSTTLNGTDGDYTFVGPFDFQFGDLTISSTGSIINMTADAGMLFVPGSSITINGSGSDGGTFTIDGGTGSIVTLDTTTGSGTFTLARGTSDNVTITNARIANSSYTSDNKDSALSELGLVAVSDGGSNTNWFTRVVSDDAVDDGADDMADAGDVADDDAPSQIDEDGEAIKVDTTVGAVSTADASGIVQASATSELSGASGSADVTGATAGSLFVTMADGNLRPDFDGIPDGIALETTMRVTSSLTGDFDVTVRFCYTDEMLTAAGLTEDELVLYTYLDPDGPWTLAGAVGQYQGDSEPTGVRGDYGYSSLSKCAWAVRDRLSDFAVGAGTTNSLTVSDAGEALADGTTRTGLCGTLGFLPLVMMLFGTMLLKETLRFW